MEALSKIIIALISNGVLWYMIYVMSRHMSSLSTKYHKAVMDGIDLEFELLMLKINCLKSRRPDIIDNTEMEMNAVRAKKIINQGSEKPVKTKLGWLRFLFKKKTKQE